MIRTLILIAVALVLGAIFHHQVSLEVHHLLNLAHAWLQAKANSQIDHRLGAS